MSLTFAIGDLHGRLDLLEMALAALQRRAQGGTVILLGDYVDHGPQSCQIIERLMAGPPVGWNWVCLKGNHEEVMVHALAGAPRSQALWLHMGGRETLHSYGGRDMGDPAFHLVPRAHMAWLDRLPLVHVDAHRAYVHGALARWRPLHRQQADFTLWNVYTDEDEGGHGRFHVVHGHDQKSRGTVLKRRRTNLDTFAWRTGRLVIGVFDNDRPGGPVELIEILGMPLA